MLFQRISDANLRTYCVIQWITISKTTIRISAEIYQVLAQNIIQL